MYYDVHADAAQGQTFVFGYEDTPVVLGGQG
jgi:hypothetical protein